MTRTVPLAALVIALVAAWSPSAGAAPSKKDIARADALFEEGRALMAAGTFPLACERLAESYRIAAGLGTLINLGACFEAANDLPHAYFVYYRAARISRDAGRFEREEAAKVRLASLAPKLGQVRFPLTLGGRATTLTCDQVAAQSIEPGIAVVDAGRPHECELRAGSTLAWSGRVEVGSGEVKTITIGSSTGGPLARSDPEPPPPEKPPAPPPQESGSPALRVVGWLLVGVGVAAVGTGVYFAVQAKSKDSDAAAFCDARGCDAPGVDLGQDAKSAGDVATVAMIAGAALVAGGIAALIVAKTSHPARVSPVAIVPWLMPNAGGIGGAARF